MRVMLWFESLAGAGHAQVANKALEALRRECEQRGEPLEIAVVSSSLNRTPGLDFGGAQQYPLQPMYTVSATGEQMWQTPDGTYIFDTPEWRSARVEQFRETVDDFRPDVILTEQWPFERGGHSPELDDLITREHPPIIALARDVQLSPNGGCVGHDPNKLSQVVNEHITQVLVFSDKDILPLSASLDREYGHGVEMEHSMEGKIEYVGFPATIRRDGAVRDTEIGKGEVLVSQGGGHTEHGYQLLESAIRAAGDTGPELRDRTWRIMCSEQDVQALTQIANAEAARTGGVPRIIVQANCPQAEFTDRTHNAALSISLAGQNTTFEVLSAGVPMVVAPIPPSAGQMPGTVTEQQFRSQAFEERGMLRILSPDQLYDRDHPGRFDPVQVAGIFDAAFEQRNMTPSISQFRTEGLERAAGAIIERTRQQGYGITIAEVPTHERQTPDPTPPVPPQTIRGQRQGPDPFG